MKSPQVQVESGFGGQLAKLFVQEPREVESIKAAIARAVLLSTYGDKGYRLEDVESAERAGLVLERNEITHSETARRADICLKWFMVLKGDLRWPIQRICDHFAYILRCELDGKPFEPPKTSRWSKPSLI